MYLLKLKFSGLKSLKPYLRTCLLIIVFATLNGYQLEIAAQKRGNNSPTTPSTSAEAKKQQQAAEKDIRETERQIEENEKKVRKELSELGKLEGEISETQGKIKVLNGRLAELTGKISGLESSISKNEKELEKLRNEYLKAIKKMRVTRKNKSGLAFIFSSGSFSQAMRRMRYLKEFSAWRERQNAEINSKIADLKNEKEALAKAREEQSNSLKMQQSNEKKLEGQRLQEETLIAKLKENGEALDRHLQKKQAEATKLNGLVSNLIAQEQRQAEEKRLKAERARIEEQRRLEEQRKQEELKKAEAARQEEQARLEEAKKQQLAQKENPKPAKSKEDNSNVNAPKQDEVKSSEIAEAKPRQRKKKENSATKPEDKSLAIKSEKVETGPSNSEYANVRKRAPRSQGKDTQPSSAATKETVKNEAKGNSFQDMKGRLPRPVNGSFRITSLFGRQSLPDLPGVEYDNPGIDAEVSKGASALAVYKGKVSGVYLLPGYNTVVIVNHDGYYTVYGNIASATVKVGDTVKEGQALGTVVEDEDNPGRGIIHFEVWKNRDKLNPQDWIK